MEQRTSLQPRVFIGSSNETRSYATVLKSRMDLHSKNQFDIQVWHQNIFEAGFFFLETLLNVEADFAILLFSADDKITSRKSKMGAPRDNVVFESGLFVGRLGLKSVFFVRPNGFDLKLPTDLLGITFVTYEPRSNQKPQVFLDQPAFEIFQQIEQRWESGEVATSKNANILDSLAEIGCLNHDCLEYLYNMNLVDNDTFSSVSEKIILRLKKHNHEGNEK